MPEGNKSRVSGDGVESKRPATNFLGVPVGPNWISRLVEKSSLGVELRRLESPFEGAFLVYRAFWLSPVPPPAKCSMPEHRSRAASGDNLPETLHG